MSVEIALHGVSKRYGRNTVLSDVSFTCRPGTITAFCGPNGAGKTTALRVLAGLTRPDAGAALINGRRLLDIEEPARAIGVVLDASAFHPGRTVRETLRLGAMTMGVDSHRAVQCVELVGLGGVQMRRVGQLSLGMRQRLGIAHALLGDPGALVLDEPSNGLDPGGILWLDHVLTTFADRGGTVLVSTHQLAAVERTADRLVAVSRGRVVADTALSDVRTERTTVGSDDTRLGSVLRAAGWRVQQTGSRFVVEASPVAVGRLTCDQGIALCELRADEHRLDEFLATVSAPEHQGKVD
ncbi:ABC-2 type transport system ATP-binding protein [Curtobacterium herbarum]|uniref:ABC transporter ATP-binding protein n=1 Tax=Curtobacterium herbarum TaxID=150122 RepID=UPI00209EA825|nr:ATP-binding cassette domain-containing protein [Curtobacterium herbarum]MCP1503373.1 ABC-2 type transport system ATP-binding protein [Curtobacterium herbarum]